MTGQIVTVFGGTGFLGRRVVSHLRDQGFAVRIASRHVEHAGDGIAQDWKRAHINDEGFITAAAGGACAVVNAVSLYRERGSETFNALHVKSAERVARQTRQAGVERLIHVLRIGADARSKSPYIRGLGEGELAVQAAFTNAVNVRPAVLFGPDDAFLRTLVTLLRRLPVYPMFGRGETQLPVHVEDVAEAIAHALQAGAPQPVTYEPGGLACPASMRSASLRSPSSLRSRRSSPAASGRDVTRGAWPLRSQWSIAEIALGITRRALPNPEIAFNTQRNLNYLSRSSRL